MKKYTKEELYKMDAVEVYKLVLQKEYIKKFPDGFWQQPEALDNAIKCTKYLIEDILCLSENELKEKLSKKLFYNNGLGGMLKLCFNNSPIKAVEMVYPNKFKPWEFKFVTSGYWQDINNGIEATRWLIEEKLKLTDDELKERLSQKMFYDNGLCGMLTNCFKGSPFEAISATYPNRFKPWELNQVPLGYWNDINNGIEATRWLIEEKLKLTDDELKEQLSSKLFEENGLGNMLDKCFNGSPYGAVNAIYPDKFKPWDFNQVPLGYWENISNGIEATRWLIEEKLKLTDDELKEQLSSKLFEENGLCGMLQQCFNSSPFEAISATYPNRFKPWELNQVPLGYWNDINNGIEATRWLIEEKLKLTDDELKEQLSQRLFEENDLGGMLDTCFNGSPFKAINSAYPNKFRPWEFNTVKMGYWKDINHGTEATKWLIEEKLKLTDDELKEKLSCKLFKDNGFAAMLNICFNSSPFEAINAAYPGKFKKEDFKNYKRK